MRTQPYSFPSLTSLSAFEAAGRHLSFKDAASELNVTAPAISRQIRFLENELGKPLFRRLHRQVELTPDGEILLQTLRESFVAIDQATRAIQTTGHDQVRVGTTHAFASLWLMPRLQDFWRRYPDIRLHHIISDESIDSTMKNADITVRYGHGNWPATSVETLFCDRIYAACSPLYKKRLGPISSPADLSGHTLIEITDVSNEDWPHWSDWFEALDVDIGQPEYRFFDSYGVAIQAAMDGLGVVMGWDSLIRDIIKASRLVRYLPNVFEPEGAFCVVTPQSKFISEDVETFRQWMVSRAHQEK